MKKIDLLYSGLIKFLEPLSLDFPGVENYADSLSSEKNEKLIDTLDSISNLKAELDEKVLSNTSFSKIADLKEYIDLLSSQYSDFPNFRNQEINTTITILSKITTEISSSGIDLTQELDISNFDLKSFEKTIKQKNAFYLDSNDANKYILLITMEDQVSLHEFLDASGILIDILITFLYYLGEQSESRLNPKCILVPQEFSDKTNLIWSTLCLSLLAKGENVHNPYEYNNNPIINSTTELILGNDYHQFSDSIEILSDYNYQKDILHKYLMIYHLIENFMYKSPLVKLESQSMGEEFSIRDFKRMYDLINTSEISALKNLCSEILNLNYSSTQLFKDLTLSKWESITTTHSIDKDKIDYFILILGIRTKKGIEIKYDDVNESNISGFFAQLIYAFRNCIVHNRETEFHLNHTTLINHPTLNDIPKSILEYFLLPLLEEIIFDLILKRNPLVWYTNSTLTLWKNE